MTVAQIEKFVRESVDKKISWERIRILGGEPTLHLHLRDILNILSDYKKKYSPRTAIVIFSNGFGQQVQTVLLSLPGEIEVFNTAKKHVYQQFRCFNLAPVDSCLYRWSDYTNGCAVIANCGIGLTPSGYYPCIVAGGIDRIFGLNKGRYNVPDNNDDMRDQLKVFCKLCGHFRPPKISDQEKMSHTWKRAYKKYALSPPALTPY